MKAIAVDRWNQSWSEEAMWTLRTSGGTEGDDRTPIVAIVNGAGNFCGKEVLQMGEGRDSSIAAES